MLQSELTLAIADLKSNHKIYFYKLIEVFLKKENYENLAEFLIHCQERYEDRNILHLSDQEQITLLTVIKRIRARKYIWEEFLDGISDDESTLRDNFETEKVLKDNEFLKKVCLEFLKTNYSTVKSGICIGKTVSYLRKMFSLDTEQTLIMQFLLDCELAADRGEYLLEYASLFSWHDTKDIFQRNLHSIISVFVVKIGKDYDFHKISKEARKDTKDSTDSGVGYIPSYRRRTVKSSRHGTIFESSMSPFSGNGYTTEGEITPFWPQIPPIYIKLLCDNKEINLENVADFFKDHFKQKLNYTDFKNHDRTQLVERLVTASLKEHSQGTNILFYGEPGTGKTELVYALAAKNKWRLITIGDDDDITPIGRIQNLRFAQSFFSNFKNEKIVFLFDEMEDLLKVKQEDVGKNQLNRILENSPFPIFWTSNNVWEFEVSFLRRMAYASKFDIPDRKERERIWKKFSKVNELDIDIEQIKNFSVNYKTSPSVIGIVSEVSRKAKLDKEQTKLVLEDLVTVYNQGDEPDVPDDPFAGSSVGYDFNLANSDLDIQLLIKQLKKVKKNNWSALLYGAPGTGKSALARVIAKELGMKIICKRASDLMDMYVGQNEKNIAEAFEQAKDEEAILLIDEADSFLRSRGSAQRSWEVSLVNEMLSQMESIEYPFIATSNLQTSLDEASLRRFTFKAKFDWLKTDQLALACKTFFKVDLDIPRNWKLAPGDLVSVQKRVDILGLTSKKDIFNLLKQEVELKNLEGTKEIGFSIPTSKK